jgi:Fe-S cluster assembly protein SufD
MNAEASPFLTTLEKLRVPSKDRAWQEFIKKGLPSKQQEAFCYVSFDKLYNSSFSSDASKTYTLQKLPSTPSPYRFVFIDGVFSSELSSLDALDERIVYGSLETMKKEFPGLIKSQEDRLFDDEHATGFDYLNEACYQQGFFLYIAPKLTLDQPLECLHITTAAAVSCAKALIFVGKNSSVKFHHSYMPFEGNVYLGKQEYHLEAGSQCHVRFDDMDQNKGFALHQITARLKKDSNFSSIQINQSGMCYRKEYRIDLLEDNAEAALKGLTLLEHSDQSHIFATIRHLAPNCRSHQHFKALLQGSSRASFEGKIWVAQQAQQTQAYQLCNHLLLSSSAHGFAKPNLEIFADDVKASHGATIAQLNAEDLFYLKARGLSHAHATQLLIKGFCKEILQHAEQPLQTKFESILANSVI